MRQGRQKDEFCRAQAISTRDGRYMRFGLDSGLPIYRFDIFIGSEDDVLSRTQRARHIAHATSVLRPVPTAIHCLPVHGNVSKSTCGKLANIDS